LVQSKNDTKLQVQPPKSPYPLENSRYIAETNRAFEEKYDEHSRAKYFPSLTISEINESNVFHITELRKHFWSIYIFMDSRWALGSAIKFSKPSSIISVQNPDREKGDPTAKYDQTFSCN
jgi:hypothetical protein